MSGVPRKDDTSPSRRPWARARWAIGLLVTLVVGLGVAGWLLHARNTAPRESAAAALPDWQELADLDEGALTREMTELAVQLAEEFPDEPEAALMLGHTYQHLGDAPNAEKWFDRCLRLKPDSLSAYDGIGRALLKDLKYEKALAVFREGTDREPRVPAFHVGAGKALMGLGRYAEAADEVNRAIQLGPASSDTFALLGQACLRLKDYEKAKQAGERALAVEPVATEAYWVMGAACAGLGLDARAEEHRKKFAELDRQAREAQREGRWAFLNAKVAARNLAISCIKAALIYRYKGCADKAEQLLRRAVEVDPKNVAPRAELASLYVHVGRPKAALALCDAIMQFEPTSLLGPLVAGRAWVSLDRPDEAEKAFRKAIDLAPWQADGYGDLARLCLKTGRDLPEAKVLASTAVRLAPLPQNLAVLGEACSRSGDLEGARAAYERALKLQPGNPEIKKAYEALQRRP